MKIDKNKPVMVTGATGYLAGWVVKGLLEEGLTVHATVRDPEKKDKLKHLDQIAEKSPGSIRYFKADLLTAGAYDEAMKDCELVFHTASPFVMNVKDAQRDLINPALKGTKNVLDSVNRTSTVKRVVQTSSCAAIYGDNLDLQSTPNGVFTEEVWNTSSSATHQAYSYSKVLAEKECWKMVKEQDRWDLVVMNPSFILGPALNSKPTSASFDIMKNMGDGKMKFGTPAFHIGVVDVRDIAEAHIKGGFTPEANGRNIISKNDSSFLELAGFLQEKFGDQYPFPKKELPKFLVWLTAPLVGMTRKEVSRTIGHPWKADNSKGVQELGMTYRPLDTTVQEMFQQMIDTKMF